MGGVLFYNQTMPVKNIFPGQPIHPEKLQRPRDLRRAMTPAEKVLWQALRGNQLGGYHFRRQQTIAGFIVDFYCHAGNLIVEVDGGIHKQQKGHDAQRNRVFAERGLRVVHVRNEDVLDDVSSVLKQIRATISP